MPIPTDDLADSQEYSGGAYIDCQVINSEHLLIDCNKFVCFICCDAIRNVQNMGDLAHVSQCTTQLRMNKLGRINIHEFCSLIK